MNFQGLLDAFTAAVESADGAALGELFTEDGIYHDTFYGAFEGPDAIAQMLEQRFWGDAKGFRWSMRDPVCDGEIGYARWVFSYSSTLPGSEGRRVVFEGMSCFELDGDKIYRYGEIFDSGVALAQLDFAPERLAKILGRSATELRGRQAGTQHLPN